MNKLNPFEMNFYFSSNRSRVAKRHKSKDLNESQKNVDAAFTKFVDQYPIGEEGKGEGRVQLNKANSITKPVLPLLNISKVKDEHQNILALKGFNEVTRNQSSHSPLVPMGFSRIGGAGEYNLSGVDGNESLTKPESFIIEQDPKTLKLRKVANRLGEKDFLYNLPQMVYDLDLDIQ